MSLRTVCISDSLLGSIFSPEYLLELMFLCFCQLRLWFFIGSLDELIALRFPKGDAISGIHIQFVLMIIVMQTINTRRSKRMS